MMIKKGIKPEEENIQSCFIGAVLMPNGEVICLGKTLGYFKELKTTLYQAEKAKLK